MLDGDTYTLPHEKVSIHVSPVMERLAKLTTSLSMTLTCPFGNVQPVPRHVFTTNTLTTGSQVRYTSFNRLPIYATQPLDDTPAFG